METRRWLLFMQKKWVAFSQTAQFLIIFDMTFTCRHKNVATVHTTPPLPSWDISAVIEQSTLKAPR
jgi:hypothetical protein